MSDPAPEPRRPSSWFGRPGRAARGLFRVRRLPRLARLRPGRFRRLGRAAFGLVRLPRLRSVRVRITVAAVLLTTVAVGVAGWLLVRSVEDQQINQLRDDIAAAVDDVSRRLAAGDSPEEAVEASPLVLPVEVTDEAGEVVATWPTLPQDGQPVVTRVDRSTTTTSSGDGDGNSDGEGTDPPTQERRRGLGTLMDEDEDGDGDDDPTAFLSGSDYVYAGRLERLSRSVATPSAGTLTVSAAAPVEQVNRSLDALRGALVVGLPLLVVAVAATAWLVVRRALRPVEVIRAEVDSITGSTMHRRVPEPSTGDEIDRLARTMNAMLDRLDRSAQRQRQFVADASHELRSPVAAIRTGLEVARHKGDRADWLAVADRALADESRLESLLDDMLLLAAHDELGPGDDEHHPIDLAEIVAREAARPRRLPVTFTRPADDPVVPGQRDQLARVVANLLDNATRHAADTVEVSLDAGDGHVQMHVDDDGPGIAPEDRERVFERFTRLDGSRARGRGGTGLGLSLVRTLVTAHHGHVAIDDSPLSGTRVTVTLPTST